MIEVVIPAYNQPHLVQQCVDAVLAQRGVGQVHVADDYSTDVHLRDYYRVMLKAKRFRLVFRGQENVGFLPTVNLAMKFVRSEYAVIVNSDTVPLSRDCLHKLVTALDVENANVCGAKLLFMPGSKYGQPWTIQHAGVGFNPDGRPYHPFMHLHRDTRAANIPKMVTAVTGAVFAVRMSKWRELGGFDEVYGRGVYEDVDYCLRAHRVIYEPQSEWLHLMHGSQTKDNDLFDHEQENLKTFRKRWRPWCDERIYYGI